ncbi:MAG: amino acid ABC transporter permease [Clostridia bacterium]|nr:amino acid ABC transporter permease [Clostridia bacterium]MBP5269618.1 amino acid ABC transporter permease [Clostridia bacterium]
MNLFQWMQRMVSEYWKQFLFGTVNTLVMAVVGTAVGLLIGLLIAILRTVPVRPSDPKPKKILSAVVGFLTGAYVEIIRGTPMMVQALIIHYSLFIKLGLPNLVSALIIISVNTGAYMAEIVRGGIISVGRGQTEGAASIGMTHMQTMRLVVLPQALRNVMPSVCNEFVVNIKDSSVLSVISITELMFISKQAGGAYAKFVPAYVICAIIYFILTFTVSRLMRFIEKKMDGSDTYVICGSQSDPDAEIHLKKEGGRSGR